MKQSSPAYPPPLILHVLPLDLARGAQAQVRALRDQLDDTRQIHRTLTLFSSEEGALQPDMSLSIRPGVLRRIGFHPVVPLVLGRVVRRLRPAVVVAHGGEALKYAAIAVPRGQALIYHRIGVSSPKLRNPLRRWLYRYSVTRADAVVAVSDATLAELQQLHGHPRAEVIPNARDGRHFSPSALPDAEAPVKILFVGHLTPSKRPELFLDVVEILRGDGMDFEAALVGDGPLHAAIAQRAGSVGAQLLGRRDDVAGQLSASHVLVFTSLPEGEGMPGVLIEAGLVGVPAVATDVPGASDVVIHGKTGFVVGVADKAALVEAVRQLVLDPALRRKMGDAARSHCLEHFTIESNAAKWRNLIGELAGSFR